MILKELGLRKNEICIVTILLSVFFIIGNIVMVCIGADEDGKIMEFGTFLGIILIVLYGCMCALSGTYKNTFNLYVSMGCTRRHTFISYIVNSLAIFAVEYVFLLILHGINIAIINAVYPANSNIISMDKGLFSWYVLVVCIAIVTFQVVAGSLNMKFGAKTQYVVMIIWMAICILPGRISNAMENGENGILAKIGYTVKDIFTNGNHCAIVIICLAVCVLLMLISYLISAKQEVEE